MVSAATDEKIGLLVDDRYTLLSVIGEGGMGTVYAARHERIGREVALKVLDSGRAKDKEHVARFAREALAVGSIGHAHIVQVMDSGRLPDGAPYLVMEKLEGRHLGELLAGGPLEVDRALRIGRQICEALAASHEKGIVHRDVKPSNVFLVERDDGSDFVKLLDFGAAKLELGDGDHALTALTRDGDLIGTPHFMAPEQLEGHPDLDRRVDVYAVGVLLYRAITGRLPFEAPTLPALVRRIAEEPPVAMREIRPDVDDEVDRLVSRTLAKAPSDRPDSCEELGRELASLSSAPRSATPARASPIAARPRRAVALVAVALLACAFAAIWIVTLVAEPEGVPTSVAAPPSATPDELAAVEPEPAPPAPAPATALAPEVAPAVADEPPEPPAELAPAAEPAPPTPRARRTAPPRRRAPTTDPAPTAEPASNPRSRRAVDPLREFGAR